MILREATEQDLEELVRLGYLLAKHEQKANNLLKVNAETKENSKNHYKKELKNKDAKFFVAENENKIIGYIYGYIKKSPEHMIKHKYLGHLEAIFVEKSVRSKKIGKELTNKLIGWFKSKRISLIELGVYAENKESVEVWHNLGFKNFHIKMRKEI